MIAISYEKLEILAEDLDKERKELNKSIKNIGSIMQMLPMFWNSDVCSKYITDYSNKEKDVKEMIRFLEDVSDNMKAISKYCKNLKDNQSLE